MNDLPGFSPWAKGDVFVGSTVLASREDDHAGRGRILQYDANLAPKGAVWIDDTTHLVGGLKFDPSGRLWAFDSQAFVVLTIAPDGRMERRDLGRRPFSHVNFAHDGTLYLGEHVTGSVIRSDIAARMGTRIPFMPGTDRMGDGHVWHLEPDGTLIKEYATHTHGGIGGFLGVTMSALAPDESTLVYCSETGPRLMRYDLANDRQLPDLQSYPEGQREMFFAMKYRPDGKLLVLRGTRIDVVDAAGTTVRTYPLEGFGWATLELAVDGSSAYVGNFFSGELVRIDLRTGAEIASVQTGVAKSLAGIAQYPGIAKVRRAATAPAGVAPRPRAARAVAKRKTRPARVKKRKAIKAKTRAKKTRTSRRRPAQPRRHR